MHCLCWHIDDITFDDFRPLPARAKEPIAITQVGICRFMAVCISSASFSATGQHRLQTIATSSAHSVRPPISMLLGEIKETTPISRPPGWLPCNELAWIWGEVLVEFLVAKAPKLQGWDLSDQIASCESHPTFLDLSWMISTFQRHSTDTSGLI
jgi:hypothetical protein